MTQRCPDCNQLSAFNAPVCRTCGHTFVKPRATKPYNFVARMESSKQKQMVQDSMPDGWVYGGIHKVGEKVVYLASSPKYKNGDVQTFDTLREMMKVAWKTHLTTKKKVVRA